MNNIQFGVDGWEITSLIWKEGGKELQWMRDET